MKSEAGIFQLENGNWGFRFRVLIDGKKIDRKRINGIDGLPFPTKESAIDARVQAIKLEKEMQAAKKREEERISSVLAAASLSQKTFGDIFEEYCEKGRGDRAFGTIRKQDSVWKIHLKDDFGNRYIDDVSVAEIQDYLQNLYYVQGYSYRYVEAFLKMFYLIFGQAYSREYISIDLYNRLCKNKDTKIHMPKMKTDENLDIVVFSCDECTALDDYFQGTNAETAYLLGRCCGLRINEAYGLRWNDVDFENKVIHVRQQMSYQNGLIKLVPLKTRNAKRDVYMNSVIYQHLVKEKEQLDRINQHQALQREQNQKIITNLAGERVSSLELVNSLLDGKIQTVNSMKYHSREIKQKLGIEFKYHYLRHTYGTQLAVLNTPTPILCKQMGHGNIHVTERYYIGMSKTGIDVLRTNLEMI